MTIRTFLTGLAVVLCASPARAEVTLEYVGHASFVVESPGGARIVIDPFSSNRWLGYRYPDSVEADAVLVTHPHYDHDASYYWGDAVPVFREPGVYRVADVEILGVEGRHADPYGRDFAQKNTIWVVQAGGVRLVHVGDNGPLSAASIEAIGRADVLLVPADGDDHILKPEEIAAAREALGDPLVVPMHYRLEGFLGLPRSLGPVGPWLESQTGVERLATHRARITAERSAERKVLVFQPSPELEPWSTELARGWELLDEARELTRSGDDGAARAMELVREAYEGHGNIVFAVQWARALVGAGREGDAVAVLESALARYPREDWEYRMRARSLLGRLYAAAGRRSEAAAQYRAVLDGAHRTELLDEARAFLSSRSTP